MKRLFIILLFACSLYGYGQNVVTNGSFEIKQAGTGCPNQTGFDNGRPQGWTVPTNGFTPDYFFPCAAPGSAWYPGSNIIGCEYPLQGQAYAGFLAQQVFSDGFVSTPGSEYISQQVSLTANQQYYVEFYVSLADGTNTNPNNTAVKTLGMFFLPPGGSLTPGVRGLHHLTPQVPNTFPAANFYTSSGGWTKISGNFTPNTNGQWTIVIGNFDSNLNQTTVLNNPNTQPSASSPDGRFSYYFVDGVTILPVGQTPPDYSRSLSGPSPICSSGTFTVLNQPFGTTPSWSSSNPLGLSVNSSGVANRVGGFNGSATVTATLAGACGNLNASRSVVLGTESNAVDIITVSFSCVNNRSYINFIFAPIFTTATQIQYYSKDLTNPNNPYVLKGTNKAPNGGSGGDFSLGFPKRWYSIKMVVTTPCGTVEGIREVFAPACSGGGGGSLRAFPNPADNQLTLQVTGNSSGMTETQSVSFKENIATLLPFTAQLVDAQGMLRKSIKSESGIFTVDTSDLPNGIYYLRVQTESENLSQQLMVRH
jgi:hypothetical protein